MLYFYCRCYLVDFLREEGVGGSNPLTPTNYSIRSFVSDTRPHAARAHSAIYRGHKKARTADLNSGGRHQDQNRRGGNNRESVRCCHSVLPVDMTPQ